MEMWFDEVPYVLQVRVLLTCKYYEKTEILAIIPPFLALNIWNLIVCGNIATVNLSLY